MLRRVAICLAAIIAVAFSFGTASAAPAQQIYSSGWILAHGSGVGEPCYYIEAYGRVPSAVTGQILDYNAGMLATEYSKKTGCSIYNTGVALKGGFLYNNGTLLEDTSTDGICASIDGEPQPPAGWTSWLIGEDYYNDTGPCASNIYWTDIFDTVYAGVGFATTPSVQVSFRSESCYVQPCDGGTMKHRRLAGLAAAGLAAIGAGTGVAVAQPWTTKSPSRSSLGTERLKVALPWEDVWGYVDAKWITGQGLTLQQILHDRGPFSVYSTPTGDTVIAWYYKDCFVVPINAKCPANAGPTATTIP
jgi:hypothetical protein